MTNSNHTPTPWRVFSGNGCDTIIDDDGTQVATITPRHPVEVESACAAHIVRCVNAHDELVAALRYIQIRTADNVDFQKCISAALAKVEG